MLGFIIFNNIKGVAQGSSRFSGGNAVYKCYVQLTLSGIKSNYCFLHYQIYLYNVPHYKNRMCFGVFTEKQKNDFVLKNTQIESKRKNTVSHCDQEQMRVNMIFTLFPQIKLLFVLIKTWNYFLSPGPVSELYFLRTEAEFTALPVLANRSQRLKVVLTHSPTVKVWLFRLY